MKQIDLPLVRMSTDLGTALSRLRLSNRAALLSEHNGKYKLFRAENIVIGRSQGIRTLLGLSTHEPLKPKIVRTHLSFPTKTMSVGMSVPRSGVARIKSSPANPAGKAVADFSLAQITGESAFVWVRSVNLAEKFVASPCDCYCDGPRHHSFPPPEVAPGAPCPRCGHTVLCST